MPRRSKIDNAPVEIRHWLERALTEGNFSGYNELETMLAERGYAISKSAIHRYGQKIERRFAAIKASTEAARILTEGAADDQDARSEAVIALVQTEMFESIISLQEAGDDDISPEDRLSLLSKAAKNIATLARASVNQKKFRLEVQEKTRAAADAVANLAKNGGLSASSVAEIRQKILGIAA